MILNSKFTPHPVAFGIWLVADVVNYITYVSFSKYWIGPLIMPVGAATVVLWGTIKLIIAKHKKTKTEKIEFGFTDWFAIVVSVISLGVYFITGNGKLSNIMIQVIVFMGFVPLVVNLIKSKRTNEPTLSWILFCVGWLITCIDTMMGYKSLIELIYPVINGLIGCLIVLGIIIYNKKLKIKNSSLLSKITMEWALTLSSLGMAMCVLLAVLDVYLINIVIQCLLIATMIFVWIIAVKNKKRQKIKT